MEQIGLWGSNEAIDQMRLTYERGIAAQNAYTPVSSDQQSYKLYQIGQRLADCRARSKAAIMRAARAVAEVDREQDGALTAH